MLVLDYWKADSFEKRYIAKELQEDVCLSKCRIRSAAEFDKLMMLPVCTSHGH